MSEREDLKAEGSQNDGDRGRKEVVVEKVEGEVVLGDLIWVKLHNDTWWPAQVSEENVVGESRKPEDRLAQSVLVRLYGSYEYLFVDPIASHLEFQVVLKQNNGSYLDIFEKSLEQELFDSKSGGRKRKASASADRKTKSNRVKKEVKSKNSKQVKGAGAKELEDGLPNVNGEEGNEFQRTPNSKRSCSEEGTGLSELSARRLRVMQSLGLIAPSGSPFGKSRRLCANT